MGNGNSGDISSPEKMNTGNDGSPQDSAEAIAVDKQDSRPQGAPAQKPAGEEKVTRMGTASIPKLITEFAIPSVVGMLVNGSYNVIDSMFLGHAVGEIGLSAVTVANPIMIVFMALAMLVGNGGNALAALRLGEGKRNDAEVALGNVITVSLVLWVFVAFMAACPPLLDGLLTLSSATDTVRPYAASFIRILCFGFILQCVGMGVNNFIRTAGAPNRALGTMVIGLVGATIFNFFFVILFGWGVVGSALATVAGQALSCAAVLWYFLFTKGVPMRIRLKNLRPQLKVIGTILAYGFPSFAVQAGLAIINFVLNFQLVTYGATSIIGADDALASIGVVNRVAMFTTMPLVGVAISLQPLLGFNYGARLIGRVRKIYLMGVGCATTIAVVEWGIIQLFPHAVVVAFGITNETLVDFTVFALHIQFLLLFLVGFQIVSSNYFQATGQPAKSIFLTLTRQIIFLVPLLFIMPHVLPGLSGGRLTGLDALYFATPVADFLSIFVTGIFVLFELRRLKRMQKMVGRSEER